MAIELSKLNEVQREAVKEIFGPCMIIAGAGSGKTRVLTYKVAHLVESGVSPYEILALTFTNKAASEMKQRVEALTGYDTTKIWMGTFHSIFAKLLRFEAEKLGYSKSFSIYDPDDCINVIKRIMQECGYSTDKVNPNGIHHFISGLKNKMILPKDFSQIAKNPFEKIVDDIYEDYQKELIKSNAMDFDDLLIKPIELFRKYPEVLEKYQNRFKFILVDEYQDTNRAQYLVIRLLSNKYQNISIVGDDAQSIYKWRGAEIKNIFDFESDYPEKKVYRLEQNYRSTKKILALADDVIKRNEKQIDKTLWTENEEGDKITLFETLTDREEAQRISKYIRDEIHKRKLKFSDFSALYRTNAQSRVLEENFIRDGIPYIIVGGTKFYQRKEIKDILAFLKIIANPDDIEAMSRVLGLREGLGKVSIDKLFKHAEENNAKLSTLLKEADSIEFLKPQAKNALKKLSELLNKYGYLKAEMRFDEYIRGFIDEMGMLPKLRLENNAESDERIANIEEFISAAADFYDNNKMATLEDFLEKISLVADVDEFNNKKNAVVLMTIHSAKGLEFPVVFITGLEDGLFPVSNAYNGIEEMEEERRLFYVAVTRAEKKLYLSFANQRYKFGRQSFQMKSRFIKEISDDIMDKHICHERFVNNKSMNISPKKTYKKDNEAIFIKYENYKNDIVDEYSGDNDNFSDIKKGVNIFHDKFGKGSVLTVSGRGMDKKAEILFDEFGLKKIILKYAKMRVEN